MLVVTVEVAIVDVGGGDADVVDDGGSDVDVVEDGGGLVGGGDVVVVFAHPAKIKMAMDKIAKIIKSFFIYSPFLRFRITIFSATNYI